MREPARGSAVRKALAEKPILEEGLELRCIAIAHSLRPANFLAQIGRQLIGRGSGLDRGKVEGRSGACVAFIGKMVGLENERAQVARFEGERLVHCGARGHVVLEAAAGIG